MKPLMKYKVLALFIMTCSIAYIFDPEIQRDSKELKAILDHAFELDFPENFTIIRSQKARKIRSFLVNM